MSSNIVWQFTNQLLRRQRQRRTQTEREREMGSVSSESPIHVVLFPFMSKGHTIPLLHLARLLLLHRRNAAVTIFTTPLNRPFISDSLSDTNISIIDLPFPQNIAGIPSGIESTDKLPSISLFVSFITATKLIQPSFEKALKDLPNVSFIVSDGFLSWTYESAAKFGIPRLVSYGMSNYAFSVAQDLMQNRPLYKSYSGDEPFTLKSFPWITIAKNEFESVFTDPEPKGPHFEFVFDAFTATSKSYGVITNSFYELEPQFADYWKRCAERKSWCVGPLCLAEPTRVQSQFDQKPNWAQWLDKKRDQGCSVLYIAFGSQAEISSEQLREIAIGLEESEVNFLWVVRKNGWEVIDDDGFVERVKNRGLVVREWVNQREILEHECVQGFLSHCGWNSVLESICAKVPILAWPLMAEQPQNARMVAEEMKIGMRVETSDGFVKSEVLKKMVRELMEGEMGKELRKKVKELGQAAIEAVEEGGSSWRALNELIDEIQEGRRV